MFLPIGYGIDLTPVIDLIKESENRIMATVKEAFAELKATYVQEKAEILAKFTELETKLEEALSDSDPELIEEIQALTADIKGIVEAPVVVTTPVDETPVTPVSDAPQIG